ncbi:MAG: hypothetical protein M1404_02095 [Acidobacteria bacterium]|nr:hypothetical protein [Acidobacteriota bacterium]
MGIAGITGGLASLGAAHASAGASAPAGAEEASGSTVRDKFWIWGHVAGSHNGQFGIPGNSRMTPAEGAFYLGVPNIIFVAYGDPKEPCKMLPEPAQYDEYATSFLPLKRVVWSMVGAGGHVNRHGVEALQELAGKYPNIVGTQMDDFFRDTLDGKRIGVLTPGELSYLQKHLDVGGRKLDIWVTLYQHDLKHDLSQYLDHVDVVTYWTWHAKNIEGLEAGFAQAEKAAPNARKVLGCYMWDYGDHRPMPIAMMEKQCTLGLEWLHQGRIDGMIFLASCICDLGLETVEWTRNWIREVGDTKL